MRIVFINEKVSRLEQHAIKGYPHFDALLRLFYGLTILSAAFYRILKVGYYRAGRGARREGAAML